MLWAVWHDITCVDILLSLSEIRTSDWSTRITWPGLLLVPEGNTGLWLAVSWSSHNLKHDNVIMSLSNELTPHTRDQKIYPSDKWSANQDFKEVRYLLDIFHLLLTFLMSSWMFTEGKSALKQTETRRESKSSAQTTFLCKWYFVIFRDRVQETGACWSTWSVQISEIQLWQLKWFIREKKH